MHYILWIDEAGRGAWAGPVVAWGFMVSIDRESSIYEALREADDSKKLTKKKREGLFGTLEYLSHKHECQYTFGYREADRIDEVWIREATRECMEDIILSLLQYIQSEDTFEIWIDGCDNFLFPLENIEYTFAKKRKRWEYKEQILASQGWKTMNGGLGGRHCLSDDEKQCSLLSKASNERVWLPPGTFDTFGYKSIGNYISYLIHWDSLHKSISLGSIIAKVIRDRMMCEYSEDFPLYWFDAHVGYGTRKHQESMNNYNITSIHRKSYAPVKKLISRSSRV